MSTSPEVNKNEDKPFSLKKTKERKIEEKELRMRVESFPKTLDFTEYEKKIYWPNEFFLTTMTPVVKQIFDDMINSHMVKDAVDVAPNRNELMEKYLSTNMKKFLESRVKLDSMRFDYSFGEKEIDENIALKAFMAQNIERRMRQKLKMGKELELFLELVNEKQRQKQIRVNFGTVKAEMRKDNDYLDKLSPQYKSFKKIQDRYSNMRIGKEGVSLGKPQPKVGIFSQLSRKEEREREEVRLKRKREVSDADRRRIQGWRYSDLKQVYGNKSDIKQIDEEEIRELEQLYGESQPTAEETFGQTEPSMMFEPEHQQLLQNQSLETIDIPIEKKSRNHFLSNFNTGSQAPTNFQSSILSNHRSRSNIYG